VEIGDSARRTRRVTRRDIELFTELMGGVTSGLLDGTALVWTEAL
jgi:hypothetical protein